MRSFRKIRKLYAALAEAESQMESPLAWVKVKAFRKQQELVRKLTSARLEGK